MTTSQLHSTNVNQSSCCYFSRSFITTLSPKSLAKCPWQSALWSFTQKTFDSVWNALTHFATLPNYYIPKMLAVFTEANIHYSQNGTGHLLKLVIKQPLITVFILYWLLLNAWKCYPRENHTLERNMSRTFPEILHFGELYYTTFLFWKVHWES